MGRPKSTRTCDLDGCERSHMAHGYCQMHFYRIKRNGNPGRPEPLRNPAMGQECSVNDCDKEVKARGYCSLHYERVRAHGDSETRGTTKGSTAKFLKNLKPSPTNECVIWPYAKVSGYGSAVYEGKRYLAHRLALILHCGPPPFDGALALHGPCHNRACVNPNHLSWGSPKQNNSADMERDGTLRKGVSRYNSKLNEAAVLDICTSDLRESVLAKYYKVSRSTIGDVRAGRTWSWLTGIKRHP